jgi:hypothetical protein
MTTAPEPSQEPKPAGITIRRLEKKETTGDSGGNGGA